MHVRSGTALGWHVYLQRWCTSVWVIGVRDLIPRKTQLKISIEPPSFLPRVISALLNKHRAKVFVKITQAQMKGQTAFSIQILCPQL